MAASSMFARTRAMSGVRRTRRVDRDPACRERTSLTNREAALLPTLRGPQSSLYRLITGLLSFCFAASASTGSEKDPPERGRTRSLGTGFRMTRTPSSSVRDHFSASVLFLQRGQPKFTPVTGAGAGGSTAGAGGGVTRLRLSYPPIRRRSNRRLSLCGFFFAEAC
jgi:hypothetical protein